MALQFDGAGIVTFPTWNEAGDYDIFISSFIYTSASSILVGSNLSGDFFIACLGGGLLRATVGGGTIAVTGLVDGSEYSVHLRRVGTTTTLTVSGFADEVSNSMNASFTLDIFGAYNGNQLEYTGVIANTITIQGDSNSTRTYDFDQSPGDLILPDDTDNQDGTLSGFTTGGFIIPTISVTINTLDGLVASDYFCKQRDGNGQASLVVAGTYTGTPLTIEYQLDSGSWQILDASPAASSFSGAITITNQQDISVRFSNDVGVTDTLVGVTAAACMAVWWQSNAVGLGDNLQPIAVGAGNPTPIMHSSLSGFEVLEDPVGTGVGAAGSVWPGVAQLYSDAGIPVCIGNVARGGTSITEWQPAGGDYAKITGFYNACQGLELSTSIGGETDAIGAMSTADMITNLTTTLTAINTDFGVTHYLTYFPVGSGTGSETNIDNIRAAFDAVIANNSFVRSGGDLAVIDISIGDGVHLKTNEQINEAVGILYPAYNSTVLNIATSGVPDGSYDAVMWNIADRAEAFNGAVTVAGDSLSLSVFAPEASVIIGDVYDPLGADTDGMRIRGTTV